MSGGSGFEPAPHPPSSGALGLERAREFAADLSRRRTTRDFASEPIPAELIDNAISAASSAPSGAHRQPWRFVVVTDPAVKQQIRESAEAEERDFYESPNAEWHAALAPLGTDWRKPMLTDAPALIAVFEVHASNTEPKPYYVKESVGIAVGFLLAALHRSGLATLTHTPSPMRFLGEILGRPRNERPFCLVVVGKAAPAARVPTLERKPLDEVRVWIGPKGPGPAPQP